MKSVIAMAYFTQLARGRALRGWRALGPFTPTLFRAADFGSPIAVISFDQPGVAMTVAGKVPTAAWDGLPAASQSYVRAREAIRLRVAKLVDFLTKGGRAHA